MNLKSHHKGLFPTTDARPQVTLYGIPECEYQGKIEGTFCSVPSFLQRQKLRLMEEKWFILDHTVIWNLIPTFNQPETSFWVCHYLPCLSNAQIYSKDLNIKILLLRIKNNFSLCCMSSSLKGMSGAEETEGVCPGTQGALLTAKLFHQVSSSAQKTPSGLSWCLSAKAPDETEETLELKGNLKTINTIFLVYRWSS